MPDIQQSGCDRDLDASTRESKPQGRIDPVEEFWARERVAVAFERISPLTEDVEF